MNALNVDDAIFYVNKIIDDVRCATCDKLDGLRVRYPCGHSACDDCNVFIEYCPNCTPQQSDARARPDFPLTQYVQHATALSKAARNLFDPDAFQHKRISEQLKIEKALFPKCIQAPKKYENTRKSMRYSLNKENKCHTVYPGEAVPFTKDNTMKKSTTYVEQWLSRNEKQVGRKPFADLNVNVQRYNNNKCETTTAVKHLPEVSNRKRSHYKTTHKYQNWRTDNLKQSVYQDTVTTKKAKKLNKCDNDESGVFMDNELIVIDDSQDDTVDKDKAAWLAVLEAHQREALASSPSLSRGQLNHNVSRDKQSSTSIYNIKANSFRKVPFIKKSAIFETCKYCQNELKSLKSVAITSDPKHVQIPSREVEPVNITIDTNDFFTTISVIADVHHGAVKHTAAVAVQTDSLPLTLAIDNNNVIQTVTSNICDNSAAVARNTRACDLFTGERNVVGASVHKPEKTKCIIIEESDSDTDIEASGPRSVQAVVHRSCEQINYGVLTNVANVKEHASKTRRGPRGRTPASTDSSEKENYDPNRLRKHNSSKKKLRKK